jgi:hypothetical protein
MAEPTAIETALAKLRQAHNALDSHLGDTDASDFETEEEELENYPGQWAARTVMEVIELLAAVPAAPQIQQPRPDIAPGVMRCAKCKFKLIRQSLNVNVGTVTAGGSHSEPCPNGCGPLWPVTWREEALEADQAAEAMFDRAKAAEDRLARLAPASVGEAARPTEPGWYVILPPAFDRPKVRAFGRDGRWWIPLGRGDGMDGWMTAREYPNWVGPIASIDSPEPFRTPGLNTAAAVDVLVERRRQVEAEGWTPEHDDEHDDGELAAASAAYALAAADLQHPQSQGDGDFKSAPPDMWPWSRDWWKPADARRMLVKAGALNQAAIEQIDRAESPEGGAE